MDRLSARLAPPQNRGASTSVRSVSVGVTRRDHLQPSEPPTADPSVYVIFMREVADADARRGFEDLSTDAGRFEFAGREVYWLIRGKLSESPLFGKDLTKTAGGAPMTMRNMSTVCGLVAKYPSAD